MSRVGIGNNSICYEAIQRIFRNAIVDYLRRRMAEVFPGDHVEKLKKPFGAEWSALEAHNFSELLTVEEERGEELVCGGGASVISVASHERNNSRGARQWSESVQAAVGERLTALNSNFTEALIAFDRAQREEFRA